MKKYLFIVGVVLAIFFMVVFTSKKKSNREKNDTRIVQNIAVQSFMSNPNSKSIDDLLPPELQIDPWGTKYDCKIKYGGFLIWSAGPDKNFSNLNYGDDDVLIFERGDVSMDQSEDEILGMFRLERTAVLAEVLLNSKNKRLEDNARQWALANGFIIVGDTDPLKQFKELKLGN